MQPSYFRLNHQLRLAIANMVNEDGRIEDSSRIVFGRREQPHTGEKSWMWGAFYMASIDVVYDATLDTPQVAERQGWQIIRFMGFQHSKTVLGLLCHMGFISPVFFAASQTYQGTAKGILPPMDLVPPEDVAISGVFARVVGSTLQINVSLC